MAMDRKEEYLRRHRVFHERHAFVNDPLFQERTFFDPRDLIQVKYELLRKVRVEDWKVAAAVRALGLSRGVYYEAAEQWQARGFPGLLPAPTGPRRAHKLTPTAIAYVRELRGIDPSLTSAELAARLRRDRGVDVHPRSIEKALAGRQKKGARR